VADREPLPADGRLGDVNPGLLPPVDHAQHDRWLVVRAASHDTDLTATQAAAARALFDRCPECAALAADITTIAHATAVSVTPSRPRDFRLTPKQTESARDGFLDRVGRWLASPRASVVRPLASASLAIGLVLVVVAPSIQGPVQPPDAPPAAQVEAPAATGTPDQALTMDLQAVPQPSAGAAGGPEVNSQHVPDETSGATTYMSTQPPSVERTSKATPDSETAGVQSVPAATEPPSAGASDSAVAESAARSTDDTTKAIVLLGIVLAGTGVLVLLLTWLARRMSRDPFLPD